MFRVLFPQDGNSCPRLKLWAASRLVSLLVTVSVTFGKPNILQRICQQQSKAAGQLRLFWTSFV